MEFTEKEIAILYNHGYKNLSIHDREVLEDLVQTTLMKAVSAERRGYYVDQGKKMAWLKRILYTTMVTEHQNKKRRQKLMDKYLIAEDTEARPEDIKIEGYSKEIEYYLNRILPQHRETLLYRANGLSYQEIADEMGVSIGTVMSRLFRARVAFRELSGMNCMRDYWNRQESKAA